MKRIARFACHRSTLYATAAYASLFLNVASRAQTVGSADTGVAPLAEIIVTAQKRSQSINDVPMSITALDANSMLSRGITDTSDLDKVVPGFVSTPTFADIPVYTLRGIGLFDSGLASSPAVSVYVDQAPLPFPVMTKSATLDIERVEVLKGPQGILFGQNSTGGAINYIAAKPTDTFATGGDLTYERFGKLDVDGFVSGPVSDTLNARFAMKVIEGGEWQTSVTRPDDHLGATRESMGRLLLDWHPNERLNVGININGNLNQSDAQAGQLVKVVPSVPSDVDPALYDQPLGIGNARNADWTPTLPNRDNDSFYQFAVRADYEVNDSMRLTDLTSYAHQNVDHHLDEDGTALPLLAADYVGFIDSYNQELRLSSDTKRLHWVVGANYEYDDVSDTNYQYYDGASAAHPIPSLPTFQSVYANTSQQIHTSAAFGNVEYSPDDRLTLHGGLRYSQSARDAHICDRNAGTNNAPGIVFTYLENVFAGLGIKDTPVIPIGPTDCFTLTPGPDFSPQLGGTDERLSENNVSWRGGADYKTDGDTMFYANASRGYKAGVISNVISSTTAEFAPAKQERVDAYELGVKAPMFDQRVHLNMAGFYYNYANKQVRTREVDPIFGLLELIVNVPKSRVWGLDGDIQYQPFRGLLMTVAGTYLNSKVTSTFNTVNQEGVGGNFAGSALPFTPAVSVIGDAQYEWGLNEKLSAFLGASLNYRGIENTSFQTASLPAPDFALPSYVTLDLRAGLAAPDEKWRVAFFARNVTNRYYWTFVYDVTDTIQRTAAMPVTYGVTISLRSH